MDFGITWVDLALEIQTLSLITNKCLYNTSSNKKIIVENAGI